MGMKKVYTCNLCRDEIKDPDKSFGLHFITYNKFDLRNAGSTDGTHICFRCINQLYKHLNDTEIQKYFIGIE